jgi:hypothetical protein
MILRYRSGAESTIPAARVNVATSLWNHIFVAVVSISADAHGQSVRSQTRWRVRTIVSTAFAGILSPTPAGALRSRGPSEVNPAPYQAVPQVKLKIVVNRKSDLVIELITKTGVMVATSRVKGLSYIDERTWTPQVQDRRIFDSILANGTATAHVRVRLQQDGIPTITKESPDVTLTNVSGENTMKIENGSGAAPLLTAVHTSFINPNQECWSYRVDWGDESPIDQSESRGSSKTCSTFSSSKATEKILTHTYMTAGSYTITAKSNATRINTLLDRIVAVEQHRITVQ